MFSKNFSVKSQIEWRDRAYKLYSCPTNPWHWCSDQDSSPSNVTRIDFTFIVKVNGSKSTVYRWKCQSSSFRDSNLSKYFKKKSFCQFVSQKSMSKLKISNNATIFNTVLHQSKKIHKFSTVKEHLKIAGVNWKFIPKCALG